MDSSSVNISYDTVYDLVKREKEKRELQKLDASFYVDLLEYLRTKQDLSQGLRQEENLRRLITELYERREKKIMRMAREQSNMGQGVVDKSSLLKEEVIIFDCFVDVLNHFRQLILDSVLREEHFDVVGYGNGDVKRLVAEQEKPAHVSESKNEDMKMVRFLESVPKFVGTDLKELGPFNMDDMARLPTQIADVLISKGTAEEIVQQPT